MARRRGASSTATTAATLLRCYCYLPLYIFCGEHLLCARLRCADQDPAAGAIEEVQRIVGHLRRAWPKTRIVLRGDSGFCRDALMSWCEARGVDYLFGLARNARLARALGAELEAARRAHQHTGRAARRFWCTVSWWPTSWEGTV